MSVPLSRMFSLCFSTFFCLMTASEALAVSCDASFVTEQHGIILVRPNGTNDSENLHCALVAASESRIPEVRMTSGDFFLGSPLEVSQFSGIWSGAGMDQTTIHLTAGMAECSDAAEATEYRAAIKFRGGSPHIRWFSLSSESYPCSGGDMDAMLHFTGRAANDSCPRDFTYPRVERLAFIGAVEHDGSGLPMLAGPRKALIVAGEPGGDENCRPLLMGTLSLLRNDFGPWISGVELAMNGGATIGVNGNSFDVDDNAFGLSVQDRAQTVTITRNTFVGNDGEFPSVAIVCAGEPPATTNCLIRDNVFYVRGSTQGNNVIGLIGGAANPSGTGGLGVSIANNDFYFTRGPYYSVIHASNVRGGVIQRNRFRMEPNYSGYSSSGEQVIRIEGGGNWAVLSNQGFGIFDSYSGDIWISGSAVTVRNNVGATVYDIGENNVIIED